MSAFIVTVQVGAVPLQAPLQPRKVLAGGGVATSVTVVPALNLAEQVPPQSMPAGVLVTVPELRVLTESV